MEDKRGEVGKYIVFGLILGAVTGMASAYLPLVIYLAPAFLGFAWAAWGNAGMACALIGAAVPTFFVTDAVSALYILAIYVPASLVTGYIIRNKLPWRSAVVISSLLMGLAFYLNLCLPSILAGNDPFAEIEKTVGESMEYMSELFIAAQGNAQEASEYAAEVLALMKENTAQLAMYLTCGVPMAFSLADVLIARALCKRAKIEHRPMTHFALWQLSRQYTYISLAALLGALASLLIGLENANAVYAAAACVVLAPLMLSGACYMEFTIRMKKSPGKSLTGKRALYYIVTALLLPYSLMFLGFIDRVTKVRRHFTVKKDTDKG